MAYPKGWFIAFLTLVATSSNVTGYLLRNLENSYNVDNFQDITEHITEHEMNLSDQFQNHEGGVIDSPSGFLCLEVVRFESSKSGEDKNELVGGFSCHYKKQGVIMSSKLKDINSILNENVEQNRRLFLKGAIYEESTNTIHITHEEQLVWLTTTTELIQTKTEVKSSGVKTILVFHITANGVSTSSTVAELSDWVFGTSGRQANLKSQYKACSFDQLVFTPATGTSIDNGVVKVNISPKSTEYDAMSNAALIYARNTLGIDVDSFDYWMYALPSSVTYNGNTPSWSGLGNVPGKNSWYVDGHVELLSTTTHELGHNLGLHHSKEGFSEYGDGTCTMGLGGYDAETRQCFNAAKMDQLGWYRSRELLIDPFSESFSGKIIGVNDYGISNSDHVVVLEIKYSDGEGNLYITLNKAEGMTVNAQEYINQIIVTQKLSNGSSDLIEHIRVGSSATIANFIGSRDLRISVVSTGSDGDVDYASVEVVLVSETCNMDSDCNDLNACTSDTCQNSVCSYETIDNCCGNGICEFDESGETCGTCTSDCTMAKGSCAAIDESEGNSYYSVTIGGVSYALDTFITNISAKKDLAIYSMQLYLFISDPNSQASFINRISIFTKIGTWFDENDSSPTNTDGWTQVFSGDVASTYEYSFSDGAERHFSTVELTTPVIVPSGTLQSFYIQIVLGDGQYFFVQGSGRTFTDTTVQYSDSDVTLYQGAHCYQSADYCRSKSMSFQGKIEFMYTTVPPTPPVPPTPSPSPRPTPSPTKEPTNSNSCNNFSYKKCELYSCCFWFNGSCLNKPDCQVQLSNPSGEISKQA